MLFLSLFLSAIGLRAETWVPATDCRAQIRAVTCVVSGEAGTERACEGDARTYAEELIKVHDALPPRIQKMFCHLRRIFIERDMLYTGYAAPYSETVGGHLRFRGNILGLSRSSIFDSTWSLEEWMNRKEQILYGKKIDDPVDPRGSRMFIDFGRTRANSLLLFVVLHEFGHLFSYAHDVVSKVMPNSVECELVSDRPMAERPAECQPRLQGLWGAISWESSSQIRPGQATEQRPCYYHCDANPPIPREQIDRFYRTLIERQSFVTPYAMISPSEDFAESFALYFANKYLDLSYGFQFGADDIVNMNSRFGAGPLAAKMEYMSMFETRAEWRYEIDPELRVPVSDPAADQSRAPF